MAETRESPNDVDGLATARGAMTFDVDVEPPKRFKVKQPIADVLLRWLIVVVPLALASMAGLIGVEFQRHGDAVGADGVIHDLAGHHQRLNQLTATMSVIGVVGLAAMATWSFIAVGNVNRVAPSLRTAWFAAAGWLLAPGLGLAAHATFDRYLDSGSLVGITVFLAVLYIPFGTIGGASHDLGGRAHYARTWFLASVLGAFLLIVGLTGATDRLPLEDPQHVLRIRAFACYLSAMMLAASSALASITASNLAARVKNRWHREIDPVGAENDPSRLKITRSGRKLRRRFVPTLFLRLLVPAGLLGSGLAVVAAVIVHRGRAERDVSVAATAVTDLRLAVAAIAACALAVHATYMVWAIVAARNAFRRSIVAPTPWAVTSSFLAGPIVIGLSTLFSGPFGAAVLTVGITASVAGFVVGQLVLGRTVSALDGRGQVFTRWLGIDIATVGVVAYATYVDTRPIETVVVAVALAAVSLLNATVAWNAMTTLDQTCRAYRTLGAGVAVAPLPTPIAAGANPITGQISAVSLQPIQVAGGGVQSSAVADDRLTSSHS